MKNTGARLFFGVFSLIAGFRVGYLAFTMYSDPLDILLSAALALLFLLLAYYLLIYCSSSRYRERAIKKYDMEISRFPVTTMANHVEGLPIAEKTLCKISVFQGSIVISGGGVNFSINTPQITAAEVKTDVGITNIVDSISGKTRDRTFGVKGQIFEARVGSKEKRSYNHYLIINYVDSYNKISSLLFDGGERIYGVLKIADAIKKQTVSNQIKNVQL